MSVPPHHSAAALLRAAHGGPALAVTILAVAFAVTTDLSPAGVALVAGAVLSGQLSIGWSNDLLDRARDVSVDRRDKPLVTGELTPGRVGAACGAALLATVVLSLLCGVLAGLVQLGCVAAGWAYNLGLKRTALSWLPYAVAFGALPVFVALSAPTGEPPSWWVPVAAALLGVGAHIVNVLPDLADDAATGIHGLPHRLGENAARGWAVLVLWAATLVVVMGGGPVGRLVPLLCLVVVAALGILAFKGRGRVPFQAAIAIAFVDAVLLVVTV